MMSDAGDAPIGYAAAADAYWQAGWRGVLPLRGRTKYPPPPFERPKDDRPKTHYTGYAAIDPSYADITAWCDDFRDGNLCLHLPDGIIGIDVDGYGAKTGSRTLGEAEERWGKLPETVRSTSRGESDPASGIRLYRVPEGLALEAKLAFPELGVGDIDIVQTHHRYVVAWPSIHPEGRAYWWINDAGEAQAIPKPDELPWLPQEWLDGLKVRPRPELGGDASYDVKHTLTDGVPSARVQDRVRQAIKELNMPGTGRHDTACRHSLMLMRMGQSGESGVKQAMSLLENVFVAAVCTDESRSAGEAREEFTRMLTNDNAARELSRPRVEDWVNNLVVENRPVPEDGGELNGSAPEGKTEPQLGDHRDAQITTPSSHLQEIERGFWDSRESLRMVWQTSMAKMCPPWAVLGICAARVLTQIRPHVTLPDLIGGPGSLNWFAAIVAGPAGGKTTSGSAAELLVPGHITTCLQGTGEGILATFGRTGEQGDQDQVPENECILLDVDEIDSLGAVAGRSGSTTMPLLRSAFSGATLGFSYAAKDKRRFVYKHTYRMTAIIGIQPQRAGWILADSAGGTPQRLMWFPATDARIKMDRPWESGPLALPSPREWIYPRTIRIPKEAEHVILSEHVKRQQGGQDALDGHALYCREKFAYALAVLDGRLEMSLEDWELSGIAADVSTYTREMVVDELKSAARVMAIDRGEMRGVENAAAKAMQELEEAERLRGAIRWVIDKIRAAGAEGISTRDLDRKTSKHTRRLLPLALQTAQSNGLIYQLEKTTKWAML